MGIPVFLSYPKPCYGVQQKFVDAAIQYLEDQGLSPRTLGVTDYGREAPLTSVRRMMVESNGLLAIAFRRIYIEKGKHRPNTDIDKLKEEPIKGKWLTTPWSHIEAAMAYQLGLPILILREKGVMDDGILERGVVGLYMPEFDLDATTPNTYFHEAQWKGIIGQWEGYVRSVLDRKGRPPELY
jgi:hypothetical protein